VLWQARHRMVLTVQNISNLHNDEPHCYKCNTNAACNFDVMGHECALLQGYKCNLMKLFLLEFTYQRTTSYRVSSNNEWSAICETAYCDYWPHSLHSGTVNITIDVWIWSLLTITTATNHNCIQKVIKKHKIKFLPPQKPLPYPHYKHYHLHFPTLKRFTFSNDRCDCTWFIIRVGF